MTTTWMMFLSTKSSNTGKENAADCQKLLCLPSHVVKRMTQSYDYCKKMNEIKCINSEKRFNHRQDDFLLEQTYKNNRDFCTIHLAPWPWMLK